MQVLYFAWVRERIGLRSEEIDTNAETVMDLVGELRRRSPAHDLAFSDLDALRAAVDQDLVAWDAPLGAAREVAFFPPMTGG